MSERECSVCHAKVQGNKAFCPDCGAPLEQEEKRATSSASVEMDKTFNLKGDDLQQMLREMNLAVKPEEIFKPAQTVIIAPESAPEIKTTAESVEINRKSNKFSYVIGALILLILLGGLIILLLFVFRHQIFAVQQ